MSFWLITGGQQRVDGEAAVLIPSGGLPDLSRALSPDHVREWVKHLHPDAAPEKFDIDALYYWKLRNDIHQDDYIVLLKDSETIALGEVTAPYHFEAGEGGNHVWPVRWITSDVPLASVAFIRPLLGARVFKEVNGAEARIQFRKYIPSWGTKGYVLFRWVSVIILVAELVYFWPHS